MPEADGDPSLFEVPPRVPVGFVYHPDFLSAAEEQQLIRDIQQITGSRRTASFGWEYEFGKNQITRTSSPPAHLEPFRIRAGNLFNIDPDNLVQLSILEYPIGAPIGWHRDIPQFGVVLGISLNAACRMRFREYSRVRSKTIKRDEVLSVELQPRSIYLMSGASRELWQHSIPPVRELRYSVTFRTLRRPRA